MAHTVCLDENAPIGTYADGAQIEDITSKIPTLVYFIPVTFFVLALVFAYKKGFGFWGYVGTVLLGGVISTSIVMAFMQVAKKKADEAAATNMASTGSPV